MLVPLLREALVEPRLFLSPLPSLLACNLCHRMTISVPSSAPVGGSGEGRVSPFSGDEESLLGSLLSAGSSRKEPNCF